VNQDSPILLSVCIPTYNRCKYLEKSLDRIISQILNLEIAIELLISDNCSTDGTNKLVSKFLEQYKFLKYYRNETNLGLVGNVVNCIGLASGDYLWILGDDDHIDSNALSIITKEISSQYGTSLFHLNSTILDGRTNELEELSYYSSDILFKEFPKLNDLVLDKNRINAFMAISCNVVKKEDALLAISSWGKHQRFLAFPLFIYLFCAVKSVVLCKKPLLNLVYYTTSWSKSASIVYNIQIPEVLIKLKRFGLNQSIIDDFYIRFFKIEYLKGIFVFLIKNPQYIISYLKNIYFYLLK
jgi:glycosyltransferase involved in cell wall biosynthesis